MLSVTVLCVGRLKERFYIGACAEYLKRLSGYCRIEVREISEQRGASGIIAEGKELLSKIRKGAYIIALCIEGNKLTSEALAAKINSLTVCGYSNLCFIIGGSNGLSEPVKNAAHMCLSMSDMTFPHHLARVILLEQLYRSFNITKGGSYHK